MILRSLTLHNIRSYTHETIEFPEGSVLLCGDIGSGKSTVLLAVEFALFGIKRGELEGGLLLRHGAKNGFVELNFSIDQNMVTVKRFLKRTKDSVKQEAGYIILNGTKFEGTPLELKSKMFEILGYPGELVSKSKDLIYRYTVYTPQEQMKAILQDSNERLDTLRRVFGIEKYKRIRENAAVFARMLKERKKELEGMIFDLEEKKSEKSKKEEAIKELSAELSQKQKHLEQLSSTILRQKELLKQHEEKIKVLQNIKTKLERNEAELRHRSSQRRDVKERLESLEKSLSTLREETEKMRVGEPEKIEKQLRCYENLLEDKNKKMIGVQNRISQLTLKKSQSEELKKKVSSLKTCPTCLQIVDEKHKQQIEERENKKVAEIEQQLKVAVEEKLRVEKEGEEIKEKIEKLKRELHQVELFKVKIENLKDKESLKQALEEQDKSLKEEISMLAKEREELNKNMEKLKDVEDAYRKEKETLEELLRKEKVLLVQNAEVKKEIEGLKSRVNLLEEEIRKKTECKRQSKCVGELIKWVEDYFSSLMGVIERKVMARIHQEFDSLFRDWFNTLIEDETLNVRLDESFKPIIIQNGYETGIENLSGGERTSLALAYRLSLNKVINEFIVDIKTKELLILDEPTDGFSSEQLDKVREVLDQLNIRQVIIVSHEPKIESFVDSIIRIVKHENESSVSG